MIGKYSTLKKYVGAEVSCEDYGDSAVIVADETCEEILVGEEGTLEYDIISKHDGHKIEVVQEGDAIEIMCTDCGEVLGSVIEGADVEVEEVEGKGFEFNEIGE